MTNNITFAYGIFKTSDLLSIGGIVYFPEVEDKKLTLMTGEDTRKMDAMANRIMKPGKGEILLKKRIV